MYGGLFGDLPAAKKKSSASESRSATGNDDGNDVIDAVATRTKAESGDDDDNNNNDDVDGTNPALSRVGTTAALFPPRATTSSSSTGAATMAGPNRKRSRSDGTKTGVSSSSHQFLQTVGTAGTSMAFVPTAALKRRTTNANLGGTKQPPSGQTLQHPQLHPPHHRPAPTGDGGTALADNDVVAVGGGPGGEGNNVAFQSSELGAGTTTTTTTVVRKKSSSISDPTATGKAAHIHGGGLVVPFQDPTRNDDPGNKSRDDYNYNDAEDNPITDASMEDQRHLAHNADHIPDGAETADITDPYDPYIPNDLLQYWERQALAQERDRLERETREALERQRLLRERLERERQELQQSGNYQELIQRHTGPGSNDGTALGSGNASSGMGRGRGRGRGVSNLPAWLVERQRKMQEQEQGLGSGDNDTGSGDKPEQGV